MTQSLDELLRTADPDRWASSRFISDPAARSDVVALYAFDHALESVPANVSQPLLGEIRLAWWREAIEELFEGGPPRSHPALEGLAAPLAAGRFDRSALDAMIDARVEALDDPQGLGAASRLDRTGGAVARLAARRLHETADLSVAGAAGRAWAAAVLVRRATRTGVEVDPRLCAALVSDLDAARAGAAALPAASFPAVAHATFARAYAAGRTPSELEKRLRLTWAVATGRI